MNLGPVSYLDCVVFCICLAPQLLIHVGLFGTVGVVLRCLPFLCKSCLGGGSSPTGSGPPLTERAGVVCKLPVGFVYEHFFQCREEQTPFVRTASGFEDFVVRCVRFAFANIPPHVGRVFFSKPVALPFLRFRMLRHGYWRWPVHWEQATDVGSPPPSLAAAWHALVLTRHLEPFQRRVDDQRPDEADRRLHLLRAW